MRFSKTLSVFSWALLGATALSGCNGAADGTDAGGSTDSYSLSLSYKTLVNGQCADSTSSLSFPTDASFCALATLKQGSANVSGQLISFSATLGTVSPATKLTNANGVAEVIIANAGLTEGAGTVSATYTPAGAAALTATRNYEFIGKGGAGTVTPPKLSASIVNGANLVTRFKVDEAVQLQAILLDTESKGIADAKVTFSAGTATLNPASALTNSQGL
ncbi:MAG: hypothetical protein ACRDC6_22970, partial [Shewanella sp.]